VRFADLHDEPFVALPASAGPMRDFWLATDQRTTAPRVAAEASTADVSFEAVAAGLGVVHRPVVDLSPSELAVIWRTDDRRSAVRAVVDTCFRCVTTAAS
jgi:DNA-binding transcriptional LysR family regulator